MQAANELIFDFLKKASSACLGYEDRALGFEAVEIVTASPAVTTVPMTEPAKPMSDTVPSPTPSFAVAPTGGGTIEDIARRISVCRACGLASTRTNTVPGEGVPNPAVLVIGEGPGADEDRTGRPFVGKAGQLLDKMLLAIGLERGKNCFIANIVKCRPPMNRDPSSDECAACSGFLREQIAVLKPKMILAFGKTALQKLMDTSIGITKMHGKFLDYHSIPLMATFHPSALLRDESYKRPAWEDLKKFKARLLELSPDYESANCGNGAAGGVVNGTASDTGDGVE